jgi:two-component system response regulator
MASNVILLVEDNPDDVILIRRSLQKAGCRHEVVVAADGAAAIAHLFPADQPAPPQPELVLLDLKLPRVDGAEVLRRLRGDAAMRFVPVVVLTSSLEARDVARSYELGANSYIRKPVDFMQYHTALTAIWQYWLGLNVGPGMLAP